MIKKILLNPRKSTFHNIRDISKDFHTEFGIIKKEDLDKDGETVISSLGAKYIPFNPSFIDEYKSLKRKAQIIPLKEVGIIITHTGINRHSIILDAGSGSGGLCLFLANIAKEVYTCDINDEHLEVVKENKKNMKLENLHVLKQNVYEQIEQNNIDVIILDLPEPWLAIDNAIKALKIGGFLVIYNPNLSQFQEVAKSVKNKEQLYHLKTSEIIDRDWKVDELRIRPEGGEIHSGFLMFFRKILK